jgi:hypothetical protein
MKKIICCALILSVFSCNEHIKYRKTVSTLENLLGKSICFTNRNVYHINLKDTVFEDKNTFRNTIVAYFHPLDCEVCVWKLDEWYLKRKEILLYNKNVDFKFIIQSRNYSDVSHYVMHAMPDIPLIYDSTGIFITHNELPEEQKYHTFLLDKDKKIILVGSPIGNDKLWNMYKEIIKN